MKWLKNMFSSKKGQIFDQLSGLGVGIAGLAITLGSPRSDEELLFF